MWRMAPWSFCKKKISRELILSHTGSYPPKCLLPDCYHYYYFSSISGLWSGSILSASRASPCSAQQSHLKCVRNISKDLSPHVPIVDQCYTREGGQSLRLRKEVVWKPLRERVPQGSGPVPPSWRLESYRGGKSLRKGRKLQLSSTGRRLEQIQATSARGRTTLTQRTTLIDNWTKEHTTKRGPKF